MNKKYLASCVFALLAVASIAPAEIVNFSFSGGGITSSGFFTTTPMSTPGYEAITSIIGTFTDTTEGISGAITGLYTPVSYIAPPVGEPNFTSAGFSYDDTFYPGANSPNNCSDYPFYGGDFDVYGVVFNVAGGYEGALWSDGVIPGVGLIYAAADGTTTAILNDPNPTGADQSEPVGNPVTFAAAFAPSVPEPGSFFLLAIGLVAVFALCVRVKAKA